MIQTYANIEGSGPPTEDTPGAVGQIYVDTATGLRWECIEAHRETRYKGVREFYDWKCRGLDPEFVVDGLVEGDNSGIKAISNEQIDLIWNPPLVCLTFSSPEAFSISVKTPAWDGTMEYSTDAEMWNTWDGNAVSGVSNGSEYALYFRGTGNTRMCDLEGIYEVQTGEWTLTGSNIACTGNIETLLDYATVEAGEHPAMGWRCYTHMFDGCAALTEAPALPATTLAPYCYYYMFYGCTSLTTAPALPATELESYCYEYMFNDCTGLTEAPALPATTLAPNCYRNMFRGCTSLTTAPALPATTLAANCYWDMFYGCTALTTAPALPATELESYCYEYMFNGCTSIKLSETQTEEYTQEYRIPTSGEGTPPPAEEKGGVPDYVNGMFFNTGGTFTDTPTINTTYYLHTSNTIV